MLRAALACWVIWRLLNPRRSSSLPLAAPFRKPKRILVIGAGASGLVTTKILRERGYDVLCVDADNSVGGVYENKRYRGSRMVSSKYLTLFSDYRRPNAETHLTLADYVAYLREYVSHFGLGKCIQLNTMVWSVERTAASGYQVRMGPKTGEAVTRTFDAVAVCSGLHNTPRVPELFRAAVSGDTSCGFKGEVLHSADYKDPSTLQGKRVLVVGTGETAFDVGYGAAECGAAAVTMATRHGFVSIPAAYGDSLPPLDTLIMNVGTHAWESRWSRETGFHWWLSTKLIRIGMYLATGSSYGFNQWAGKKDTMSWDDGRKHIVNKSSKCMPLITRKLKRDVSFWKRWLYSGLDSGPLYSHIGIDIDLIEGQAPAGFHSDGCSVLFQPISQASSAPPARVQADTIVLATGYRQQFPFLYPDSEDSEHPLPPAGPGSHFVLHPEEPLLAFIGFVRPNVGAIPPISEMQAMWWALLLEGGLHGAPSGDEYLLQGSRLSYGVDYGYYMFALAREMNAIPDLRDLIFRSPKAVFAALVGQAHIPIFRLSGPFASESATRTCETELIQPLLARPYLMQAITLVNFSFFATVNVVTALVEWALPEVAFRGLFLPSKKHAKPAI